MYNLRFYLDDDDNVIRCDYKRIANKNELDIPLSSKEIIQSKNDLHTAFKILSKHDLNHKNTIYKKYILHEFVVPSKIIKDMKDKMDDYLIDEHKKNEIIEIQNNKKFTQTKTDPIIIKTPRNKKVKRENKFKFKKVATTILNLAILGSIITGGAKVISNYNENAKAAIETLYNDEKQTYGIQEILDSGILLENEQKNEQIPNMTDMVKDIDKNLKENNYDYDFKIYTDDSTGTKKYIDCYNEYYPLVEKYATRYGIDPKLAIAIGCQERGVHSDKVDKGGGLGLFQIQIAVWENKPIKAYNFETNDWETYTIKEENVKNIEENIHAAMMIFQENLRHFNYNAAAAIQAYCFGEPGVNSCIKAASDALGETRETLETYGNTDWYDYRNTFRNKQGYQMGDPEYAEHVFQYVQDGEIIRFRTPNNEEISFRYDNLTYENPLKI